MSVVWLIRHGVSQSNVGDLTCSSKETQLTETGHTQAREIVKAFVASVYPAGPSSIITSEYQRLKQTAQPTIEAFPQACVEQWPVHEFTYLSEKKTVRTTRMQRGPLAQQFWANPDHNYSDGEEAESFQQFIDRVWGVLKRLRYSEQEFTAVFTHGQFIQALLWIVETDPQRIDCDSKAAFQLFACENPIPTGAVQELCICSQKSVRRGRLLTDHLSNINSYEPCYVASAAPV